jgi:hypothetical protein
VRFVWAVIAFVLAAALIGAGIAQRTVFLGPDTATMQVDVQEDQPYTLIDAEVFRANSGTQTLNVEGAEQIYLAYGRTADLEAWLSDAPYTHVTLDDAGEAVAESVPAAEPSWEGDVYPGRNPAGSDLWLEERTAEGSLSTPLQLPEDVSVLLASDGHAPAPADISIVWPISNATPWAGPLIVAGALILLLGVILWVLGLRHVRRSRGPRRKGSVQAEPRRRALGAGRRRGAVAAAEPRKELTAGPDAASSDEAAEGADAADKPDASSDAPEKDGEDEAPGGSSRRGGRRALLAVPVFGLTAALLTGCSPDVWPQFGSTPTPTPTETVVAPENQQAPALTDAQAVRIAEDIAATVEKADADRDLDLAKTRLDGVALTMREVNYRIRGDVEDYPAPLPIPGDSVRIILPQAFDEWPRSAMLVVEGEATAEGEQAPPTIMNITQADPWAKYKVTTVASLEAAAELPKLAPWWLGAALVPPDSSFLAIAPAELPAAYADVLAHGEKSKFAPLFDLESDSFRTALEDARAETLSKFQETGAETGEMTFEQGVGPADPTALATLESGAIVAVTVDTRIVTAPTDEGVVVKFPGNQGVVALVGEETSSTPVVETATNQLFFAVPAQGSPEQIRLLGYSSGLRTAEIREE